jgi:hypothetical protein
MLHFIERRVYGNMFRSEAFTFPKCFPSTIIHSRETLSMCYVYMVCYHTTNAFVDIVYPHTTEKNIYIYVPDKDKIDAAQYKYFRYIITYIYIYIYIMSHIILCLHLI